MSYEEDAGAMAEERERLARLFHDIFTLDRRGQEIYAYLYRKFARSATVHTSGGIDAILQTYHDTARASVVRHISDLMEEGAGVSGDLAG
ncbi:hypothetical protein [Pseudorhodoferax sp.]|uniref:hypothetical protein n=1 Tax=Pseudorhodoferax sp. TaxID=1993553 RepID=UPI0039E4EF7B